MRRRVLLAVAAGVALGHGTASAGEPTERTQAGPAAGPTAADGAAAADGAPAAVVPRVELFTMGQGEELFEKFGHAALCLIYDSGRRRTICYNYGTTDFESVVSLFWDFLRGRSIFWVSTSNRGRMMAHYRELDRTVWRQVLPLAPAQALALEALLRENAREENRFYQYDHYRDNCSSRLRDLIDRVSGGALSAGIESPPERETFRELSRRGFAGDTGLLLLSDLLLGRVTDRRPSTYEAMFLPDILRAEVEARLGAHPIVMHERQGPPFRTDPGMGGRWVWVVLALALAAPAAAARRSGRRERLVLAAAAIPLALLGLIPWLLAVVSNVPELRWNEALLVFLPADAALPFLSPLWRIRYAAARVALLALVGLLLAVGALRQPLWLLIPVPLLTMLAVVVTRRSAQTGEAALRLIRPAPARPAEPGPSPGGP